LRRIAESNRACATTGHSRRRHADGRAGRAQRRSNEKGEEVTVQEMIKTHPQPTSFDRDALLRCIDDASTVPLPAPAAPTPVSARRTWRSWSAAFASTSIAPTPATPRAASSPARPRPISASSAQRSKPVRRPVVPVARSVSGTPSTTSTAASAPERAAAASRHATTYSRRTNAKEIEGGMARAGSGPARAANRRRFERWTSSSWPDGSCS
jgi:hypothetical protein